MIIRNVDTWNTEEMNDYHEKALATISKFLGTPCYFYALELVYWDAEYLDRRFPSRYTNP